MIHARTGARERGLTLIELMAAVAIIGILMVTAAALIRTEPDVDEVAQQLSNQVREASRKAVGGGAVRADVVTATGITARTRVRIYEDGGSGVQLMVVERLEEQATPGDANWVEVSRRAVPPNRLRVAGWRASAELAPGLGPDIVLGGGDELEIRCQPDGSCTAATIYLEETGAQAEQARVVVMPLNGAPLIFDEW